jgi:hypothetical protein
VIVGDRVAHDTNVTLVANTPAIATVGSTATIKAGSSLAEVDYTPVAPGLASFSATLGASHVTTTGSVAAELRLTGLSGPGRPLQVGAQTSLFAGLNVSVPQDTTIALTSSNPSSLSVPPTVVVPKFFSSQPVVVTALGVGDAFITATVGSTSYEIEVPVVQNVYLQSFSSPSRMQAGAVTTASVVTDSVVAADTPVTIATKDPSVFTVPSTVTIPAGSASASFPVIAVAPGASALTATLGTVTREIVSVVVKDVTFTSFFASPSRVAVNAPSFVTASLDAAPAADLTLALASSSTSAATVPASVTIPAGVTSVNVPVTSLAPGSTTISGTIGSTTKTSALVVTAGSYLTYVGVPSRMLAGYPTDYSVQVDSAAPVDQVVTLTSSNPSAATVPAQVVIPAGSTSVNYTLSPIASGKTTITATLGATSLSGNVVVVTAPSITSISFPSTTTVGVTSTMYVYADVTLPVAMQVGLTSTAPSVLTVPANVTIPAGYSYGMLTLTPAASGSTLVTATLGSSSHSAAVAVSGAVYLSTLYGPGRVQAGAIGYVSIYFTGPVLTDTTVNINNLNPSVLSTPTSVLVTAGNSSYQFPAAALAAGTAAGNW